LTDVDNVLLGTSGWSYKEWIGPFYSKDDKSLLRAYAKVFKTVEIDSTFYRYPTKGMVMGWARYSPEGFVYAAKLPDLITHKKLLDPSQGVEEDLQRFLDLMEPLSSGGKLGCLLIQLPPKFSYKPNELEGFFKILPTHVKFAVEFRNLSWIRPETWPLLEKYNVAYVNVDEPLLPSEVHLTSGLAYFRWHGRGAQPWFDYRYKPEELKPWIPKIREAQTKVKKVFGYFNNHFHGYAVENCLQVAEMLGALTPQQAKAKMKAENHFKAASTLREIGLEAFVTPPETTFEKLISVFMDTGRLIRAKEIRNDELKIEKETPERIEATVRDYHIVIDSESKTIQHDCEDWRKGLEAKRFCKHIGKLLQSIDRTKATDLLKKIDQERDELDKLGPNRRNRHNLQHSLVYWCCFCRFLLQERLLWVLSLRGLANHISLPAVRFSIRFIGSSCFDRWNRGLSPESKSEEVGAMSVLPKQSVLIISPLSLDIRS